MANNLKVLQVCPIYYPYVGGAELHIKNICERLARKYEVTVFSGDPFDKFPREQEINGVLVRRFKSYCPGGAYHLSLPMLNALKNSSFDIVHGHNFHAFPFYYSRYAKRKKFIVTTRYHGGGHTPLRNFLFSFYKPYGKRVLNEANKIIALSQHEKSLLTRDFQIANDKIAVIPNGINLAEFRDLERKDEKSNTILCVTRQEKYKGIHYLIEALILLDAHINLKIVGGGRYGPKLQKLVKQLGLSQRVEFITNLPRDELMKAYTGAGVFVLLSKYEAFGNAVAEALTTKTPCIVATTSALKEFVDNRNCFGIDYPINTQKLAELITKVMNKKIEGVNLWSWDDVVSQVSLIYEEN